VHAPQMADTVMNHDVPEATFNGRELKMIWTQGCEKKMHLQKTIIHDASTESQNRDRKLPYRNLRVIGSAECLRDVEQKGPNLHASTMPLCVHAWQSLKGEKIQFSECSSRHRFQASLLSRRKAQTAVPHFTLSKIRFESQNRPTGSPRGPIMLCWRADHRMRV
jgi:hypothetical protein